MNCSSATRRRYSRGKCRIASPCRTRSQNARTCLVTQRSRIIPTSASTAAAISTSRWWSPMNANSKAGVLGRSGRLGRPPLEYAQANRLVAMNMSKTVSASSEETIVGVDEPSMDWRTA